MSFSLVVLAAGIGSRYGGLKQMDPVGPSGEFILDYSVYDALRAGANQIVFVVRREIEDTFRAIIGDRIGRRVAVQYVCQDLTDLPPGYAVPPGRQKPWGTGHAVLVSAGAVDGPFVVANADDFYGRESFAVLFDFLHQTADDDARYAMAGFVLRNTVSEHGTVARGICQVNAAGRLVEVVERTDVQKTADAYRCTGQSLDGSEIVSMNLWGLKPSLFAHLGREFRGFLAASAVNPKAEFFLPTVVNALLTAQHATVDVLNTPCQWFGTTYAGDKAAVVRRIRSLVAEGAYPARLWA